MKNVLIIFFVLFSISLFAQADKYGRDLTLTEKTKISEILENPAEFEGKTVLVEGEILDVCAMAGCWMDLKSDEGNGKIKIKVKDGDIVFPVEGKGKTALVEGTVYKIELTKEEAVDYYEHQAEEQGVEFDAASVTGPITLYQIKGLGAEIN